MMANRKENDRRLDEKININFFPAVFLSTLDKIF